MADKAKVGVIGLGTFGKIHVQAFGSHHRTLIAAVCDINEEEGEKVSREYGCDFYTDYSEMMEESELDAVSIATPDYLHTDPALLAANKGLHILLEKPMATTVDEAEQIMAAVDKSGSKLMIDFHNRWSPPFIALKNSIEEGEMGVPKYLSAALNDTIFVPTKMLRWSHKSNVLWFLGSHLIDICRWLFQSNPRRVLSTKGEGKLASMGIDTPDFFHSLIEFQSGALASLENCWILPESHPSVFQLKMDFVGSEGSYTANVSHSNLACKYTERNQENPDMLFNLNIDGKHRGFATESIYHFADCIVTDRRPRVTGEDGIWVTRTIDGLLKSSIQDRWITL